MRSLFDEYIAWEYLWTASEHWCYHRSRRVPRRDSCRAIFTIPSINARRPSDREKDVLLSQEGKKEREKKTLQIVTGQVTIFTQSCPPPPYWTACIVFPLHPLSREKAKIHKHTARSRSRTDDFRIILLMVNLSISLQSRTLPLSYPSECGVGPTNYVLYRLAGTVA